MQVSDVPDKPGLHIVVHLFHNCQLDNTKTPTKDELELVGMALLQRWTVNARHIALVLTTRGAHIPPVLSVPYRVVLMEEYVLTSSHLTLYLFDVRWGIRYNKEV